MSCDTDISEMPSRRVRALLLYPEFPPSFWSFEGALELIGKKALLPPLGLITAAAILPQDWEFKLVDCNAQALSDELWEWADIVMLSGMIVQQDHMSVLIGEAKARGKLVAVGGPYVTSLPGQVRAAGADFLVLDEGEITIPLFVEAFSSGETSGTFSANGEKPDVTQTPVARYDLVDLDLYSDMSIQFSRGCPFRCEFCDIIILYGRRPRTKSSDQVLAELQTLYDLGWRRALFVVDDNFIGNKKTVKPVLEAMAGWQERHDHPFHLTTEASIDLADDQELLQLMRRANFGAVFIGIETPDVESLALTKKTQNLRRSMVEQVLTINRAGLRIMAGFIIGFDGEKAGADRRILEFVNATNIPYATLNLLQALPNTHLTNRLRQEGRLFEDDAGGRLNTSSLTNFVPTRPLRELAAEHVEGYRDLFEPKAFVRRTHHHCKSFHFPRRRKRRRVPDLPEIRALMIIIWRHGVMRNSRRVFWSAVFDLYRANSLALPRFLICCAHFEHFYTYRTHVEEEVEKQLAQFGDDVLDRTYTPVPAPEQRDTSARAQMST